MKTAERNKKIITILGIFTIIFTVMGGSLAYWTWSSSEASKTNVSFSVGAGFSCSADGGGNITPTENITIMPTSDCANSNYAIQRIIKVTPEIQRDNLTINMNMWLNVNYIGTGLSNTEYFKYALTTTEGSCTEGVVAEGDFKGTTAGSKVNLLENREYKGINILPETYYLYIWLHEDETDPNTMDQTFDFSLGGECTDAKIQTLSHTIMSLANTEGSGVYEETGTASYGGPYNVIPASESGWTSIEQSGESVLTANTDTNEWIIESIGCVDEREECDNDSCWIECTGYGYDKQIEFIPKISGYYDLYESNGMLMENIYINDEWFEPWAETPNIGYLTPNDKLTIIAKNAEFSGWYDETINLKFTVSQPVNTQYDAGYRYEGKNVNNYIKFNDELWRIISVEEGSTIGLAKGKYYTKIIRNEILDNSLYYPADVFWEELPYEHLVNDVLNNEYYNKGHIYYESYENNIGEEYIMDLDYREKGLNDVSKTLIAKPNWYSIKSHFYMDTPANTFANEKHNSIVTQNYVGLMSPSDYGYGALQSKCKNTKLAEYSNCINDNWLFLGTGEYLLSDPEQNYMEGVRNSEIDYNGNTTGEYYFAGSNFRPVVYLDHKVIITNDGTGEIDRPYEIGLLK